MLKFLTWPAFLLILLVQWLVPIQMIWKKDEILAVGVGYKFETAPIDPSDPFLGKYIVLNYKENNIRLPNNNKFPYDSSVFVSFEKDKNGFAKIKSISTIKPSYPDYLETKITYIGEAKDSVNIFIDYPFTRYYMNENKAPMAEKVYRERRIDSTVKVYALVKIYNGDAVIKDVYVHDSSISDVIRVRSTLVK